MKQSAVFFILFSAVIILGIIGYYNIIELGFSQIDDDWMLLSNPQVRIMEGSFVYFEKVFTNFWDIQYSPLNTLYYGAIYQINGFDPYYFHIFSLFVHVINSLLLYVLSGSLLGLFNKIHNVIVVRMLVSLFWLVLPINVESVAWISASKVLFCTAFTIISLIGFVSILKKGSLSNYLICFISFVLSFFFKEQAVLTPVMFLVVFFLVKRDKVCGVKYSPFQIWFFILLFLISAGFGIITLNANKSTFYIFPFFERLVLSFYCFHIYVFNTFFPINLRYNYQFPMNQGDALPLVYYVFPVLFLCTILILKKYFVSKKHTLETCCFLLFVVQIMLVLQIVPLNRPALFADRYMYLPSYFLLLITVYNIFLLNTNTKFKYQQVLSIILLVFLIFYTTYSNSLVTNWNTYILK